MNKYLYKSFGSVLMSVIIGITHSYEDNFPKINADYLKAVSSFGAVSLIISYNESPDNILDIADGIILSGGGDLSEYLITEKLSPKARGLCVKRDVYEAELCRKAFAKNIPLLGICRGIQVMNTSFGGNIYQHIDGHISENSINNITHKISISKKSFLYNIIKNDTAIVNSFHHQCLSDVSPIFDISATSDDSIIEAVECPKRNFFAGVQWHPEKKLDEKLSKGIFEKFFSCCLKNSKA